MALPATKRLDLAKNFVVRAGDLGQFEHLAGLLGRGAGHGDHLFGDLLRPDLAELVEGAKHRARSLGESLPFQQPGEQHAVVQADGEIADADRPQQVVDDQGRLDVGGRRAGADGVEVALHELAEAAGLGTFAAPDGGDVVTLEGRAQFVDVLRGKTGQRHREIEPQPDPPLAMILEAVELLVGFLAALAGEDFQVFQGRRVDGAEAVGAIDPPGRFHEAFAGDHHLRQIVAEALQGAGGNKAFFRHGNNCSALSQYLSENNSATFPVRAAKWPGCKGRRDARTTSCFWTGT